MSVLTERIRAWLHARRWSERRTAEGDVAPDPHQVTQRPRSDDRDGTPGTTGTGPNGTFVGRVSGEDVE